MDLSPVRKNIQVEEARFRSAVSEALAQKLGAAQNFINTYQKYDKQWFINGAYYTLTTPFLGIDGLIFIPDNALITNAFMFVRKGGSSGSTSIDVKRGTTPGGSFATIFSTAPAITSAAGDFSWCNTGSAFANTTAPVLSTTNLNAGDVLRCDLLSAQGGTPAGCGLILFMQPR